MLEVSFHLIPVNAAVQQVVTDYRSQRVSHDYDVVITRLAPVRNSRGINLSGHAEYCGQDFCANFVEPAYLVRRYINRNVANELHHKIPQDQRDKKNDHSRTYGDHLKTHRPIVISRTNHAP